MNSDIYIKKHYENTLLCYKCINVFENEKELKKHVNGLNRFRWNNFNKKITEWILSNLDIDIVLDRISNVGIEGLNKIEKKFLDNYKV